ncbi:DUF4231 domain-containing protein [Streptomyces goshikiensis]|uniref:DUF4231 domain-containing protein n=1 Tax=Streptomyces goshikiensis TaxID=1942 RepID=UPI0022F3EF55|nr:DUF4231 domain-containing protein [Streptomyces goshikiensis]WBY25028.1 DUF4231 domain-containing protein [Streptomyces goshikiensis]
MAASLRYGGLSGYEAQELQDRVWADERDLAWKMRRTGRVRTASALAVLAVPGLVAWSAVFSGRHQWLVSGRAVLWVVLWGSVVLLLVTGCQHLWKTDRLNFLVFHSGVVRDRYKLPLAELRDRLDVNRAALHRANALTPVSLREQRGLYRVEVAAVIENYQAESRKYRRVHNGLQSLIMIGSTTITTVAALDAKQWNWQTITVITLGFCVTLASTFTGYYKYRERSYFLQQTADAIEEEANAVALGVGEYGVFGEEEQDQALAKFTQRVESLRNEQRRRQQQLDQPAEHAPVQGSSGV